MGPYLKGATSVIIEEPYIRAHHQIQNFVRFCETALKVGTIKKISLTTGYDEKTQLADIAEKLDELKQSLLELDVELDVQLNPNMHDREIRLDNGWLIKIGRGLDFYQKPGSWFEIGATDLSMRKCLETKVDIFRQ
jgi:ATP-dependent Lon protease